MSSGLEFNEKVTAQLRTVGLKPSKCRRSGTFCKAPVVIVGKLKNGEDNQEIARFYRYHRCIPQTMVINGEKVLAIQMPLPCQYYNEDDDGCSLADNIRPLLCNQLLQKDRDNE